jgi:serine/threonine protein phosphatase PrpC
VDLAMTVPQTSDVPTCPSCGAAVGRRERWCEACGAELSAIDAPLVADADLSQRPTSCSACSGDLAPDGYCTQCGTPVTAPRDHWVDQPAPWVAGCCDRGIRHQRNEDAMALAARTVPGSFAALVVCDGVSSTTASDVASLAAARTARDVLLSADDGEDAIEVLDRAGQAAGARVRETPADPVAATPPSSTFVAGVLRDGRLSVGWVGDSRAYWVPDDGDTVQLSEDDSWVTEAVAEGMPRELAERNANAHAITRWLGIDSPNAAPRTMSMDVSGPGWVLLCSDGLWNYCSAASELQALVARTVLSLAEASDPAPLAEALVAWAIVKGGQDNITVALARLG